MLNLFASHTDTVTSFALTVSASSATSAYLYRTDNLYYTTAYVDLSILNLLFLLNIKNKNFSVHLLRLQCAHKIIANSNRYIAIG